uniref:EvC ciliary complex subunit 2 n=1 Tax=Tetraodon nigroviridis TaxID=99883 RepID=H3D093_TETNG
MLLGQLFASNVAVLCLVLTFRVLCLLPPPLPFGCYDNVSGHTGVLEHISGHQCCDATCRDASNWAASSSPAEKQSLFKLHIMQHHHVKAAERSLPRMDGTVERTGSAPSPVSSAAVGPWQHSFSKSFGFVSKMLHIQRGRGTLTEYNSGFSLPQVQSAAPSFAFGVKFHKCAQVKLDSEPPQLTFYLMVDNSGPVLGSGTNLSQVAIRDSTSGIVPIRTEGRVVERGYQIFAIDSLSAGSQVIVNYTAHIRSHKIDLLDLPAFLTFSNASQNDVSMFGPLTANLTLRVNSTDRIQPNHDAHFAGFVVGFFVTIVLLSLGFLAINLTDSRTRLNILQQNKKRRDSDINNADCDLDESFKEEAAFEDKIVDIMVLKRGFHCMNNSTSLEMSTLLRATNNLEVTRIQIYKDVMSLLLGDLPSRGHTSVQTQQRLLSVLDGQLLGMEGRLKEERGARMTALANRCNLESREEMEAEHHREAAEKAQAKLLCKQADQQELLHCSVLMEKLHKLKQSQLQDKLLVQHEEASAKVQRQIIEWRRVELHKIFSEELEESTRMGEMERKTAESLQHEYFDCQDYLEEVLDMILANQRYVLAERHAQRKFLVHSLHSLNGLISDTFSITSDSLDNWFSQIKRGSTLPAEQVDQLQDKAQKELVMVRQRLDETMSQEKRSMRCGLVKKRRELLSDMLRVHRQRQNELSGMSKDLERKMEVARHLQCWQNLLTAHSLELAELINNLDEEAAADIRKVTMRVIQSALNEVKAIQPSAAQDLLALLPPGTPHTLLQIEHEAERPGQAQGVNSLQQGQEKLHQEGKTALHTLRCTRVALQETMEKELQEQRERRAHSRAFFSCLCSSQVSLCEEDRLKMKLEFLKCLSVMDRCLVLPHAVSKKKLHTALVAETFQHTETKINFQVKWKTRPKREQTAPADLLLFQKRLEARIQLFQELKEMESVAMNKVKEEMQREREDDLRSGVDSVAMQMAALHYQKAERNTKVLETTRAALTLHGLLIQNLSERKNPDRQNMAQCIQNHCLALEEAEQRLQKKRTELEELLTSRAGPKSDPAADCDEREEERLFQVQRDCLMASIVQDALYKREQVILLLAERLQEMTCNTQAMEDLKEQMRLTKLEANCDQDLLFASQLVKQSQVSAEVLLEALRLLLPVLPESELLSITDALRSKQQQDPTLAEQEQSEFAEKTNRLIPAKLRADALEDHAPQIVNCAADEARLQERRQSLMGKLLPRSRFPVLRNVAPPRAEDKEKDDRLTADRSDSSNSATQASVDGGSRRSRRTAEYGTHASAGLGPSSPATAGKLFVFRDPPQSCDLAGPPRRKRKNFLNLKKSSVAPTDLP